MAVKIQTIEESFESNGIKILVHGLAGIGKTVLCATTGAPTLIINCEAGMLSLRNAVANGLISQEQMDMVRTVKVTTIQEMREIHSMLVNKEIPCGWVCLDSITEIAEVVLETAKKEDKDPRKSYGTLIDSMNRLIKDFRDLPHYNVLMTCKMERFTDQFTNITSYVPSMPGSKLGPQIPYLFDEVYAMREVNVEVSEGKTEMQRVLQTGRDMQYEAKDRSGCLALYEPPSIKHVYDKMCAVIPSKVTIEGKEAFNEMIEQDDPEEITEEITEGVVETKDELDLAGAAQEAIKNLEQNSTSKES